jgi:ABC-type uncharacterized transport system substrate-binding protein
MAENCIKRRDLLALLGSMAATLWPLAAAGQPSDKMWRIGMLIYYKKSDPEGQTRVAAFREAIQKLGWIPGRNIQIEERWSAGDIQRIAANAAEIVKLAPDVIVATSSRETKRLHQETRTIPIVFVGLSDPVGQGLVTSLARPGGNMTGFSLTEFSVTGKMLEALKELAPASKRVGLIVSVDHPAGPFYARAFKRMAPSLAVEPIVFQVRTLGEIQRAIESVAREPNGALLFPSDVTTKVHRDPIIALAARHRLPAIYSDREYVRRGGLLCYGADLVDMSRQAASYVDRILRGAKPADLPVQQPSRYAMAINLKTAQALGLAVPQSFFARVDEVIE